MHIYRCRACHSTAVQVQIWISLQSDQNHDEAIADAIEDNSQTYCQRCEGHTGIYLEADSEPLGQLHGSRS